MAPLSIEQQEKFLRHRFPSAITKRVTRKGEQRLLFEGRFRPTPCSGRYTLRLIHPIDSRPFVWVHEPEVVSEMHGCRTPHLNRDGSLCLFDPFKKEWLSFRQSMRSRASPSASRPIIIPTFTLTASWTFWMLRCQPQPHPRILERYEHLREATFPMVDCGQTVRFSWVWSRRSASFANQRPRVMTLSHAAALHFDGRSEAAKKRIQKLKAQGLVGERPRKARDPSVLKLSPSGWRLLHEHGHLVGHPTLSAKAFERRSQVSDLTICHELAVMDVKAAMVAAINATEQFKVVEFSTWPLLHEFTISRSVIDPTQSGRLLVKPDGFIRIHEREPDGGLSEHSMFLEVDRSTESLEKLADKAAAYLAFYRSGGFAERSGGHRSECQAYPFRVLFVLPTPDRRDNTAQRLLLNKPPSLTQVWLATMPEVTTDPLGSIWLRPRDFRDPRESSSSGTLPVQDSDLARQKPIIPKLRLLEEFPNA